MISFDRDQWRVRSEAHFMIMRPALNAIRVFGIVALTTVPSGLFAQTYLSDATICRRAINSDRSGWVVGAGADRRLPAVSFGPDVL